MKEPTNHHEWRAIRNEVRLLKIEDFPKVDNATFEEFKKSALIATSSLFPWRATLIASITTAFFLYFSPKILGIKWGGIPFLINTDFRRDI